MSISDAAWEQAMRLKPVLGEPYFEYRQLLHMRTHSHQIMVDYFKRFTLWASGNDAASMVAALAALVDKELARRVHQ